MAAISDFFDGMHGVVFPFGGTSAPAGFLMCDGSAVSRATYAALFSVIGTAFGAGDGSTTFNVPELRGEFIRGLDNGRGVDAGRVRGSGQGDAIRNITGSVANFYRVSSNESHGVMSQGPYGSTPARTGAAGTDPGDNASIDIDVSRQVPTAAENRPRNVAMHYIIKT